MGSLSALDEQLLQLVRQHGRLTLADALTLTKANRNTLKLHFGNWCKPGGWNFSDGAEFVVSGGLMLVPGLLFCVYQSMKTACPPARRSRPKETPSVIR